MAARPDLLAVVDDEVAGHEAELQTDIVGLWAIISHVRGWSYRNGRPDQDVRWVVSTIVSRLLAGGAIIVDLTPGQDVELTPWPGDDLHGQFIAWWDGMGTDPHLDDHGWLYLPLPPPPADPPV